jgi:hypothetical protein
MTFVVAGLAAVAALAALNLLLTLGIIRRMREQAQVSEGYGSPPPELILGVGERPTQFTATTVDGHEVSATSLAGPTLVGFFSPRCTPCKQWIPRFARAAAEMSAGPGQALAVVAGDPDEAGAQVSALREFAQVVVEEDAGPVSMAFAVKGYPSLCRLGEDGTVASNDNHDVVALPVRA